MYTKTLLVLCAIAVGSSAIPYCKLPPQNKRHWRFPPRPVAKKPVPPMSPSSPFFDWKMGPISAPGRPLIVLYEHENHKGVKYEQYVGPRCYNLPNVMNDRASSVDTNGRCVSVCMERDCKRCKKMMPGSPGHYKLSEIKMDDVITSLRPCGDIYE